MPELDISFILASFVAGIFMFLAPCTLPLVPAYIAFISGVDEKAASKKENRRKVILNSLAFVVGFSLVFTTFGLLAGLFGSFFGGFRDVLVRIGGLFIIFFAVFMMGGFQLSFLAKNYHLQLPKYIKPGHPTSSFIIGSIFALGWTPCIGPVLASVLILATSAQTALSGALLLAVFSAGLAIPFVGTALMYAGLTNYLESDHLLLKSFSFIGGLLLMILGFLLLTDNFNLLLQYGYKLFAVFEIETLFKYY